jgi:hypothetical protein
MGGGGVKNNQILRDDPNVMIKEMLPFQLRKVAIFQFYDEFLVTILCVYDGLVSLMPKILSNSLYL